MVKKNILANLTGNFLIAIVFLICVPVYVKYLGVESYGLIGFFASLQVVFSVLDAGLSATLSREFAKLSVSPEGEIEQKNLLRTFEWIYFSVAIFISTVILFLAPLISKHWLSTVTLSSDTVWLVLIQMGVLLALRWPMALYSGGLTGLQKQVVYTTISTSSEIIKALGAIIILIYISNSIVTFFYWQIIISALTLFTIRSLVWKQLPPTINKPIFSRALLKKNRAFAAGMGASTLTTIILTQSDKIILSKILNLQTFGYYTLAYALASSLTKITVPVAQAVYPRLVQLVHTNQYEKLTTLFHTVCQLLACFIVPITLIIIFFAKNIVMIWTGNQALTDAVYPLVRIFVIGSACNALVTIPFMAQLAHGWTKLAVIQNIIAIVFLIPSIIYLTNYYGVSGAVWVWAILNISYILISMPVMYSKILKTEIWKWYWDDVFKIIIITLITIALFRLLFNYLNPGSTWFVVGYCIFVLFILLILAAFSATYIRQNLSILYNKFMRFR